jgi:hypothetical protein
MDNAKILVELTLQNQQYLKQLTEAQKKTKSFADGLSGSFKGLGSVLGGAAIVGALYYIKKETGEAQANLAKLNAVIQSTGGSSGVTAKEAQDLAQRLSGLTAVDDDLIVGAEAVLLRFSRIGKETFPEATKAALNLSAATGKDLAASALLVGEAYNDPIKGVALLKKSGAEFNEVLIRQRIALGDIAGAQKLVTEGLNRAFGGQAEAQAKTLDAAFNRIEITLGNLAATAGNEATPGMILLSEALRDASVEGGIFEGWAKKAGLEWSRAAIHIGGVVKELAVLSVWLEKPLWGKVPKDVADRWKKANDELEEYNKRANKIWNGDPDSGKQNKSKKINIPDLSPDNKPGDKADSYQKEIQQFINHTRAKNSELERLEADHVKVMDALFASKTMSKKEKLQADLEIEKAYTEKLKELHTKQAAETMQAVSGYISQIGSIASAAGDYLKQQVQDQLATLEEQKSIYSAAINMMAEEQMRVAGVQELTEIKKADKSIVTLQKQITKEKNVKKKKQLQDQLTEKQNEKKRLEIQQDAADKQNLLNLLMLWRKNQIMKKEFENNKIMSINQLWMSAGIATMGAWASAMTSTIPYPANLIMAGITTAMIVAMAAIQTGIVASQNFTPMYEQGVIGVPNTGPAIIHEGETIIPKTFTQSIQSGEAALVGSEGASPQVHIHVYGNNYGHRDLLKIVKTGLKNMGKSAYSFA